MFLIYLSVEKWVGNKNEGYVIDNPNWIQIETAISELDGKSKTLVTMGADDDTYMSIGGGESGKYIVTVTFDNINFQNLIDSTKQDQLEKLVVGGQQGTYQTKMCVDLNTVLLVAKTFAELGKLESSVYWEEEQSLVIV